MTAAGIELPDVHEQSVHRSVEVGGVLRDARDPEIEHLYSA